MRAYICFQQNDGWFFHLLSEDCQKPLTKWRPIESEEALIAMIAKMRGDITEAENSIQSMERRNGWCGSVAGAVQVLWDRRPCLRCCGNRLEAQSRRERLRRVREQARGIYCSLQRHT